MSEENKIEEFESWFLIEFKGSKTGLFEKVQNSKSNADIYVSEYVNLAYACYVKLESELTRLREENERQSKKIDQIHKLIGVQRKTGITEYDDLLRYIYEKTESSLKGETT